MTKEGQKEIRKKRLGKKNRYESLKELVVLWFWPGLKKEGKF